MPKGYVFGWRDRIGTPTPCPECGRTMAHEHTEARQPTFRPGDEQIIMPVYAAERGRVRHSKGTMPGAE